MHPEMKNLTCEVPGFNLKTKQNTELTVFPSRLRDLDFLPKHFAATPTVLKQIKVTVYTEPTK